MTIPEWVQDAIFYQIFPDRFANGDHRNDPANVLPWEASPTNSGFHGGDLQGIIQKFDYFLDLGINAIYLNPIFLSPSNHRYNTTDYYQIDPKLGTMKEFQVLVELAHKNNIHIILDGVFNHCGRGFFAFNDILENQQHSPYKNWFHILHFPIDAYSSKDRHDYLSWWNIKNLPKLNIANPQTRRYILEVARFWIQRGADGWRLDVPIEIDDDQFWNEFRAVVKSTNSEAYLLGEIWEANPRWIGDHHFDGLMNYPVREALLHCFSGKMKVSTFSEKIEKILNLYPPENMLVMYSLLGSHDTERIATLLSGDQRKLELAFLFEFAYPGTPAIYYGDEIGMSGGKDPDNRRTFPWEDYQTNIGLRSWVQALIKTRKSSKALRRGKYQHIFADDGMSCFAFARIYEDEQILVLMNLGQTVWHLEIPVGLLGWNDGKVINNILGDGEYIVSGGLIKLALPAFKGMYLT